MSRSRQEWTVGSIAEHHKVPIHRVEYVIHSRGVAPQSRAGKLRIFSDEDVALIGRELRAQVHKAPNDDGRCTGSELGHVRGDAS